MPLPSRVTEEYVAHFPPVVPSTTRWDSAELLRRAAGADIITDARLRHEEDEIHSELGQLEQEKAAVERRLEEAISQSDTATSLLNIALRALIISEAGVLCVERAHDEVLKALQSRNNRLQEIATARQDRKVRIVHNLRDLAQHISKERNEVITSEAVRPSVTSVARSRQPAPPMDTRCFLVPDLVDLEQSVRSVSETTIREIAQYIPAEFKRQQLARPTRPRIVSREDRHRGWMAKIDDGLPETPADVIEERWNWLRIHAVRTNTSTTEEWIPRDQLGSNRVLVHAWVHLRGLADRFMYNPRTQEWKDIDIMSQHYPVHKCIANLDSGSATTIISMHTAKMLQCPIHQNVDALPMRGVQGANFEANYHCTVVVSFLGTYWDSDSQQYVNGAYEMVLQALILPTLSVPILIGNQALRDHYYDNIPGTLDFSMGRVTPVACKAVSYDTVRSHCVETAAVSNLVTSAEPPSPACTPARDALDLFRGGRTVGEVDEDTAILSPEEAAVPQEAPHWYVMDGGMMVTELDVRTYGTMEYLIPPQQSVQVPVLCCELTKTTAVQAIAVRANKLMPSLFDRGVLEIEDCVIESRTPCIMVTNRGSFPVRIARGDIQVQLRSAGEDAIVHQLTFKEGYEIVSVAASGIRDTPDAKHIQTYPEDAGPARPTGFPEELWKYVSPHYRDQAVMVFNKYTPDRLAEALKLMEKLDVYDKQSARGQRTLAQAYYNLDGYFHPVADQPPVVEGTEFCIETEKDIPRVQRHKRLSSIQKASLEARVRKMMRQGKLQPSRSPISLGMVLVEYPERIRAFIEKHGPNADAAMLDPVYEDEVAAFYRLTVDLRPVNEVTIPDMFPLPRLLDLLDSAHGSTVFSLTDLEDAFFTIALAPKDRYKTAFSTHHGHFEFCVMPQGARNAANVWARHVSDTFEGIPSSEVMVYQDDIFPHAPAYEMLFERMQKVYDRVKAKKNVLKLAKTHLDYPEVTFLGHVLSRHGRRPCPKKTAAIRELAMPTSVKDVQCYLGMLTFYRDYIPAFATLATPLYGLLKKGINFDEAWGDEHVAAINETKRLLTSYEPQADGSCSVLRLPDFNAPYRLHIDAAKIGTGLGAVLLQQDKREVEEYRLSHPEVADISDGLSEIAWHPVAYWSKTITGAQKKYSATELETMALHHAILHFHAYLQNGREFEVITDHKALVFMINRNYNINNSRLARYALDLQGYHFRVTHRDGVKNLDADAVSRLLRQVQSHGDYLTRDELMDSSGIMEYTEEERELMEKEAQYCQQVECGDSSLSLIHDQFVLISEGRHLLEPVRCHMMTRSKAVSEEVTEVPSTKPVRGGSRHHKKGKKVRKQHPKVASPGHLEARLRNPKKWRAKYSKAGVKWNGSSYDLPPVELIVDPDRQHDEVEEQWDAEIVNEELLADYQYLVHKHFRGTDGVVYVVTRLAMDPERKLALAYTKRVDTGVELETALPIFGDNGVLELTEMHWTPDARECAWPETEADMFALQQQDDILGRIIGRLKEMAVGDIDSKGYYIPMEGSRDGQLQHGVLMRLHPSSREATIVIPQVLRETLLRLYHDSWAHPGTQRMYDSLRRQYSWPGMRRDVHKWVGACHACHLRKAKAGAAAPPLMIYDRLSRPFERVHIDLTGPLPMTAAGYDYILVFKCALTKWVEIFPIQSKSMERVVECFVDEIYCRHGAPSQIITDRGTEFVNRIMRETCKLLRIKKVSTTPGHPQADGMAEKQMGTLKDALYHYVNAFQDDWDGYLPVIAHAYRTTVNVATGYSPFYLLYGREARQPHDQWIRSFTGSSLLPEYVKNLATALAWSWDSVGEAVVAEAERVSLRERTPHVPRTFREYQVGELIYLARVPRRAFKSQEMARAVKISRALQARFCGPYRIVGKWSPVLYKIEVNGRIKTVHALKMKSAGRVTEPTYEEALKHFKAPDKSIPISNDDTAELEEIFPLEGGGEHQIQVEVQDEHQVELQDQGEEVEGQEI